MSGAVSMKISSRTSVTSTSGMMLISASVPPMRRLPPPLSKESTLIAVLVGEDQPRGEGSH